MKSTSISNNDAASLFTSIIDLHDAGNLDLTEIDSAELRRLAAALVEIVAAREEAGKT